MRLRDNPNFAWLFEENPDYPEDGISPPAPTAPAPTTGLPPPEPGDVRTTPVTPTISAPVVPTVTQVQPVYTPAPTAPAPTTGLPPPEPGEVRTTPVTGVTRPATSITTTPVQGVGTAAGTVTWVDPATGKLYSVPPEVVKKLDDLAREKKIQQNFENDLKLRDAARADATLKVSEMLAAAEMAYKEALIAGADADRAQRAAQAAMEQNYRMQLLAIQQQVQGQKLSIEQRQMQEERRRRRPFAPRPAVTVS